MDRNYRLGWSVVGLSIVLAGAVCLATIDTQLRPHRPAGEDLGDLGPRLGSFTFQERNGQTVTDADLTDDVWIAAFIFTRCPSSCPRISTAMRNLQTELEGTGVRLASITVDPEYDTPEVLDEFARRYSADPERWWFLTGPQADTYELIERGFLQAVAEATEAERAEGAEAIIHSPLLSLVDRGNQVVGFFNSTDEEALQQLARKAKYFDAPPWSRRLPAWNASLNGLCGLLLLVGWGLIRAGRTQAHIVCMVSAIAVSAVFLASYLVYHYQVGSVPYQGTGGSRVVYFTVLLSHTVLAAAVVPLILLTVYRAIRRDFDRHTRIAKVTLPIWLYVSLTGVVIYVMLYLIDVPGSVVVAR